MKRDDTGVRAMMQCNLEHSHAIGGAKKRGREQNNDSPRAFGPPSEAINKLLADGVVLVENGAAARANLVQQFEKVFLEKTCAVTFRMAVQNAKF